MKQKKKKTNKQKQPSKQSLHNNLIKQKVEATKTTKNI